MKLRDEQGWNEYEEKNSKDGYSLAVITFSKRWANLMEQRMDAGEKLEDIAKETSHQADTEGITGFMYGCAVQGLACYWEHGEELRRWHNIDTQIRDEGVKANESGGVLNPAVMNIGRQE